MADDESGSSSGSGSLSKLTKGKHGKTVMIVVGVVVLYLAYKYWQNSNATATPASATAPGSTAPATDGTSGTSGGGTSSGGADTTGTTNLSPSEQLAQWFSNVEQQAISANPNNAAGIDATLADIQNNVPLTTAEQQTWQSILGQFGAPPSAVGGQQDVYTPPGPQQYVYSTAVDKQILLDAGVPIAQLKPFGSQGIDPNALYVGAAGTQANQAGMNVQTLIGATRVQTQQLVDNLLGVSTGGNSIATNGNNPTNTNLGARQGGPVAIGRPIVSGLIPVPDTSPAPAHPSDYYAPNSVHGAGIYDPSSGASGYSYVSSPAAEQALAGSAFYYEPSPGNFVHISSPAAMQQLPAGTPIYTKH